MSIGTTRGFGMDEDTALVVTGINSRPIAKVAYNFLSDTHFFV
jgi:hypothetical protein